MTKAVGDFLGTNGIADEMIRFNGFPFLEKEDHAYNVSGKEGMLCHERPDLCPVSAVMRKELHVLRESGMSVGDVGMFYHCWRDRTPQCRNPEAILSSTNVKGFPIVSSDGPRILVGFIGRTELRYVLGRLLQALDAYLFKTGIRPGAQGAGHRRRDSVLILHS